MSNSSARRSRSSAFLAIPHVVTLGLATMLALSSTAHAQTTLDTETQKITASDGLRNEQYGFSVAIEGSRALVGAYQHGGAGIGAGAVYSLHFNGEDWVEDLIIIGGDTAGGDRFGSAVAIDGDLAAIGAPMDDDMGFDSGSVYLYRHDGTTWRFVQKLVPFDGEQFDFFGRAIELEGDVLWVGTPGDDQPDQEAGSVYVYRNDGSTWQFEQRITSSDATAFDSYGRAISAQGTTLLVGASEDDDDGGRSGSAYIVQYDGSSWNEVQKIRPKDGKLNAEFGRDVSLDGEYAIIGAPGDTRNEYQGIGSAYAFHFDGTRWVERQKITCSDGIDFHNFGNVVELDGRGVTIAARNDPLGIGTLTGSAYVFRLVGSRWIEERKLAASDRNQQELFGVSIASSDGTTLIGASGDTSQTGAAYVFLNPECRAGTVNAGSLRAHSVLRVNAETGGTSGDVSVPIRTPIIIDITTSESGPGKAFYVLYAWLGAPDASTVSPQPLDIGATCFPTFLTVGLPKPSVIWNNVGHENQLGVPTFPSFPAPSTVFVSDRGSGRPLTFTLQGFLEDNGSAAAAPWSVTNAIVVTIE